MPKVGSSNLQEVFVEVDDNGGCSSCGLGVLEVDFPCKDAAENFTTVIIR